MDDKEFTKILKRSSEIAYEQILLLSKIDEESTQTNRYKKLA